MTYLLDTNMVSESRKRIPNPRVATWLASVDPNDVFISVMTFGEIQVGIERLRKNDPTQAEHLGKWSQQLRATYRDRIVPVELDAAQAWGRFNNGRPTPFVDGLLAATAIVRDWVLVTRNVSDMASTGVRLLNPFEE